MPCRTSILVRLSRRFETIFHSDLRAAVHGKPTHDFVRPELPTRPKAVRCTLTRSARICIGAMNPSRRGGCGAGQFYFAATEQASVNTTFISNGKYYYG